MKYVLPAISLIVLIAVIAGAAFYFGQKSGGSSSIAPTPSVTQLYPTVNTQTTSVTSAPTTQTPQTTTISAGGVLVFSAYTLSLPPSWTSQKETTQYSDMLTLTKDTYKITIYQAAGGGGGCTYPGQAPQEMAQSFSSFVEIMDPNGFVFRRGPSLGTPNSWTVCQKNASDGSFGFPTNFGNITIVTPTNPTDTTIAEIDSILASLNKK